MAAVIVDGFKPLIGVLKVVREKIEEIDPAKIEREIFPIKECHLDVISLVSKFHEQTIEIIEMKLDNLTAHLRERFEGNPMPFGLTDDEAWEWYKRYVSEGDACTGRDDAIYR